MIHLYSDVTPNGLRASIVLEETGLPYKAIRVNTGEGQQHSAEFAELNPARAIPVIVDEDGPGGRRLVLAQSGAIVLYVAEKSGRFMPEDPRRRALAYQWFMQIATDVTAASSWIFNHATAMPVKHSDNATWLEARLMRAMSVTDRWLTDHEYLADDEVSIADLLLFPTFSFRRKSLTESGSFGHLCRWGEAMACRPGVQRGLRVFGS
jgi:GST-like protein